MGSVPTLAIMETLEPVLFLAFSTCLNPHEKHSRWTYANTILVLLGVVLAIIEPVLEGKPLVVNIGYLFFFIGNVATVGTEIISHIYLSTVPLGVYAFVRVILGKLDLLPFTLVYSRATTVEDS